MPVFTEIVIVAGASIAAGFAAKAFLFDRVREDFIQDLKYMCAAISTTAVVAGVLTLADAVNRADQAFSAKPRYPNGYTGGGTDWSPID